MKEDALRDLFRRLEIQILQLIAKTDDPVAHRATVAALLYHKVPGVSWTGFYFLRGEDLVVEASQGPVVVPIHDVNGRAIGVLDVDSYHLAHFTEAHRDGYGSIIRLLEDRWNG